MISSDGLCRALLSLLHYFKWSKVHADQNKVNLWKEDTLSAPFNRLWEACLSWLYCKRFVCTHLTLTYVPWKLDVYFSEIRRSSLPPGTRHLHQKKGSSCWPEWTTRGCKLYMHYRLAYIFRKVLSLRSQRKWRVPMDPYWNRSHLKLSTLTTMTIRAQIRPFHRAGT